MRQLCLTSSQLDTVIQHCLHTAPEEACGLLLGSDARVRDVLPMANIAQDPEHHYRIADEDIARHYPKLIGIYHSHPASEPLPSPTDVREAWSGGTVYLIVGLRGTHPAYSAWWFEHGRARPVHIHVDDCPPAEADISPVQKWVMLISAIMALIFLVVLSLYLLPPAPPIP
ncbi:MAG: hypothetical protein OHK0046_07460 [Anaerolineae bacterium]